MLFGLQTELVEAEELTVPRIKMTRNTLLFGSLHVCENWKENLTNTAAWLWPCETNADNVGQNVLKMELPRKRRGKSKSRLQRFKK